MKKRQGSSLEAPRGYDGTFKDDRPKRWEWMKRNAEPLLGISANHQSRNDECGHVQMWREVKKNCSEVA